MIAPILYNQILKSPEIREELSLSFDFELVDPCEDVETYDMKCTEQLTIVATEGAGGFFALSGTEYIEKRPLIFVSSEGQAGKIAGNFNEAIELILSCPYWFDLLKFSGGGRIEEMYKAVPFLEDEAIEDEPDIKKIQIRLINSLGLVYIKDPVLTLYNSVSYGLEQKIYSKDGEEYNGLFNTFVVSDNPMWKKKVHEA